VQRPVSQHSESESKSGFSEFLRPSAFAVRINFAAPCKTFSSSRIGSDLIPSTLSPLATERRIAASSSAFEGRDLLKCSRSQLS